MTTATRNRYRLNAVCPYFTMYPLNFPLAVLEDARSGKGVFDPFCGRGTTGFAARIRGLCSIGIDSSPVAVAIAQAKLVGPDPETIVAEARQILCETSDPEFVPDGEFWSLAFHPTVLGKVCRLREELIKDCGSDVRIALRAIILGALHGPRPKGRASYLSNQSPRTYAPKPRYAVGYWRRHGLVPENVDVVEIVAERARRYFSERLDVSGGSVAEADSRDSRALERVTEGFDVDHIITSPPYYGLKTYIPDQWLRRWFVGGCSEVDYDTSGQLTHASPEIFADDLRTVWRNVAAVSNPGARLTVRFGGINDRRADPLEILYASLDDSGFEITGVTDAGTASDGRRQVLHFSERASGRAARREYDVRALLDGDGLPRR